MAEGHAGEGRLFADPDPEAARAFFRTKTRALTNKVMSVRDAVTRFVHDGDYLASGGFGTNRIATAVLHEILRQGRSNLGFAGHTTTHDFTLIAAGNFDGRKLLGRVDAAYVVGLEARGLSPHARQVMESGEVEVVEWTNYSLALRYRAAAAGVPFLPLRSMLGTDTFRRSAAREIRCPFTGLPLAAVPALYPDVAFIHVHESDCHGNCRLKGITVADAELARAAKRLIVTAERLVSNESIRASPEATIIPSFCVDAVCEVPFGSYPGNMPGEYYSDEAHLREWLDAERDDASFRDLLQRYVYGVADFEGYLRACGGIERIKRLRAVELLLPDGESADA